MGAKEIRARTDLALDGDFNSNHAPPNQQRIPPDNLNVLELQTDLIHERPRTPIKRINPIAHDHSRLVATLYDTSTGLLRDILLALRKVATINSPSISLSDYVASDDSQSLQSSHQLTDLRGSLASLRLSDQAPVDAANVDILTKRQAYHFSFRRAYHSLKLWADGLDVLDGDLDEVLLQSTQLRIEVLYSLRTIGQILAECR